MKFLLVTFTLRSTVALIFWGVSMETGDIMHETQPHSNAFQEWLILHLLALWERRKCVGRQMETQKAGRGS